MFSISNLSVTIGTHTLLRDLSCEFPGSALCMVLGPNGAGKTTLLKCLDGGITPTRGNISFCGKTLGKWDNLEIARRRAVLPQHSNLEFPFTAKDVVLIGRAPHHTSDEDNLRIAMAALHYLDCGHLAERPFPTLSGGEQQRVHIARVLAQIWLDSELQQKNSQTWDQHNETTRFLLLDEPVSALDLKHQYDLLTLLRKLAREQQLGIVCSLHNLNLAAQFADRCVIIDDGKLVAEGTAKAVLTEDIVSAAFNIEMWVKPHPENPDIPLIMPKLG